MSLELEGARGYNADEIDELQRKIESVAITTVNSIMSNIQSGVLDEVGRMWFAGNAQTWGDNFVSYLKSYSVPITEMFNSVIEKIYDIGKNWGESMSSALPNLILIKPGSITIDVNRNSIMDKDENGNVQMYTDTMISYLDTVLPTVLEDCNALVVDCANTISSEAAFIGGTQAGEINQYISSQFKAMIRGIKNNLTEGEDSLVGILKKYSQSYIDVANSVSYVDSNDNVNSDYHAAK